MTQQPLFSYTNFNPNTSFDDMFEFFFHDNNIEYEEFNLDNDDLINNEYDDDNNNSNEKDKLNKSELEKNERRFVILYFNLF